MTPPRTMPRTSSGVNAERTATVSPGWRAVNRRIIPLSGSTACDGMAAISTRPASSPPTESTAARAASSPRTICRAGSTRACPAWVSTSHAADAVEQADAEVAFEDPDGLGERGLRDVEGVRGPAHPAVVDHGEEVLELPRVHTHLRGGPA